MVRESILHWGCPVILHLEAKQEGKKGIWKLIERDKQLKCTNCGEAPDHWQYVTLLESSPLKGGRGHASFVSKCKLCSRESSIDIIPDSIGKYSSDDEGFKSVVHFDCRGLEPVDFDARVGWVAEGTDTGTRFEDIDLKEKEWVDYDDKAKASVGIYEFEHQFHKEK
ncbi:unnamed protein product [Darwinula stevensoni]|uniref:Uncharacterized protein n=1 Tax=Darwinula stevensoni TaxID=69355 RepID=A0A7R9FSE2_9CRUS|nr:unnamed protein product [Darwinula stevensoni]CAG0903345.1 unnamed protein product [Darwinula stevensoni]